MKNIFEVIKNNRAIAFTLLFGFLATITYAFYFRVNVTVDAQAYDSIAVSLVQGTGYAEITRPELAEAAIGRLGPGYEFFLATIYKLFGHNVQIVWGIQSLIHVGSAFLVYLLVRRFRSDPEWPAVLAAGVYVFFIDLLEFPAMLMTETLYLFLVLGAIHFSLNYVERARLIDVVASGVLFALALLVRPPITIAMMVFLGFILFRKEYRHALAFVGILVLFLAPWTIRNYLRYDRLIITSAIIGYDVWVGNSPDSKHVGELTATDEIDRYSAEKGLFAANERGTREVLNLAIQQPWTFIKLQLTKTSIYFSAARPAAFWFHLSGLSQAITIIFSSLFAYAIFVFGLAGAWRMLLRKDYLSRIFIFFTVAAPIGIIWIVAETRYRYQIYPMLIILAVLFLKDFLADKRAHLKPLLVSLVLVTANTLLDFAQNSSRVIERIQRIF